MRRWRERASQVGAEQARGSGRRWRHSWCHGTGSRLGGGAKYCVALAGNPNVGKSSVFNGLTALGAVTANYPGKTVEVSVGTTSVDGLSVALVDLPGTYALGGISEDQRVARRTLLEGQIDAVLAVVDATNLARNLYLVLQLMDLGLPVAVALNLVDEAERHGLRVDAERLAAALGVPVVPTVATSGSGLRRALRAAIGQARRDRPQVFPEYGKPVDQVVAKLASRIESVAQGDLPGGLDARALAVLLLEEDAEASASLREQPWGETVRVEAGEAGAELREACGESPSVLIARRRHDLAARLAREALTGRLGPSTDRFLRLTTSLPTGLPILLLVLAATFAFLFFVGNLLSTGFSDLWETYVSPLVRGLFLLALPEGLAVRTLLWGFDAGIQAALAVGIPYVLTFYFLLALLEDSGYLSSVAFLTDQGMRRLGLHGRAIIPLVAGAGCNVPAIIGTRVLTTARERTIASALIVLVPCSARTAVILGAVSLYLGWQPAVAVFAIVGGLVVLVGIGLNRLMPGSPGGLVVEMFPLRWPYLANSARKCWYRFREFVFIAAPIVVVGSLVLGALYETGYVWSLAAPLSPVVEGWLGLPAVAGLTLLFAVLRKELALQLLVTLAIAQYGSGADDLLSFMGPRQIFVYALVNTIYIPCAATFAPLGKEIGWWRTCLVTVFTITLALVVGGSANRILMALGWT